MSIKKELETYCPKSPADWRAWLEKNHESEHSIWLIYYRVSSKTPSLTWSQAVDEALCFGWIDSTKKTIDEERYMQYFSKRKAKSNWSKVNKEKIVKLIENKRMQKAGYDSIATAKQNGSWTLLDAVENLIIPEDLKTALNKNTAAMEFFQNQSNSIKKILLYWVVSAKRIETKDKRIAEIVESAAEGLKPKQFR